MCSTTKGPKGYNKTDQRLHGCIAMNGLNTNSLISVHTQHLISVHILKEYVWEGLCVCECVYEQMLADKQGLDKEKVGKIKQPV